MTRFELPKAPAAQTEAVKAWSEPVTIPTYLPMAPDKNPMFLEKRVYQGSSGAVYPLPFYDRVATGPVPHSWQALHIENEFVRVMVLPEIGGRIHIGLDKTNNYDFFYRQNVIKPALVGLAGPWCSGGVEFNWPQHHRPATYMPVETQIEQHADGSQTIWCSDHDPMHRLKGMHGVCLHPGKSYIELKVRLYNRTPLVQTFLWWANLATHVHELYQSFFPPDVHYVADHARRAMSKYPLCEGEYYGVNYGARAKSGIPAAERPDNFIPPGTYPPNDISWYANIPVPTSYMAVGSSEDFSGGYDHKKRAGLILLADHHIAPGKKQWTWGNHRFGYAWDRNLTDDDGPYIELMTGVFTDNQPDFSFLDPGETKVFNQYWYPIREIGPAQTASLDGAASLVVDEQIARAGVCVTRDFRGARVRVESNGSPVADWKTDLSGDSAFVQQAELPPATRAENVELIVSDRLGYEILRYRPAAPVDVAKAAAKPPAPATEPAAPSEIASNEELFVIGLHLDQYRHVTRHPEIYWCEALRRDPGDSRCNNAMGLWRLRRGEFADAEKYFRAAIARLTSRNANPYDEEPHYNLGLTLRYLGRDDEAYDAFYKATWSGRWQAVGFQRLAEIDATRLDWPKSAEHALKSLRRDTENLQARNLATIALRMSCRSEQGDGLLKLTRELDRLDIGSRYLASSEVPRDAQMALDLAFDLARCGMIVEAIAILERAAQAPATDGSAPMVLYSLAAFRAKLADTSGADRAWTEAAAASPDYCFPNRLEELIVLETAVAARPNDARAPYYLGNLLYARRRHKDAIAMWERSTQLDSTFSIAWRNLGIAYFNIERDPAKAREAFEKALAANPTDSRVLYERDQLWKRIGERPESRLAELERHLDLANSRDDLSVELASLYNQTRQHEKALAIVRARKFQPWEGGEGLALGQHVRTYLALGRRALQQGKSGEARKLFEAALDAPENLGEAKHPLANQSDIHYWLGVALDAGGNSASACEFWERAAAQRGDFQLMRVTAFSELTFYNALALARLGRSEEANDLQRGLVECAESLRREEPKIDYFATSLPQMLLFEDDARKRSAVRADFLEAQARIGLGDAAAGRKLLGHVLAADPNNAYAADLLAELDLLAPAAHSQRS